MSLRNPPGFQTKENQEKIKLQTDLAPLIGEYVIFYIKQLEKRNFELECIIEDQKSEKEELDRLLRISGVQYGLE